jgi:hypothetical protein
MAFRQDVERFGGFYWKLCAICLLLGLWGACLVFAKAALEAMYSGRWIEGILRAVIAALVGGLALWATNKWRREGVGHASDANYTTVYQRMLDGKLLDLLNEFDALAAEARIALLKELSRRGRTDVEVLSAIEAARKRKTGAKEEAKGRPSQGGVMSPRMSNWRVIPWTHEAFRKAIAAFALLWHQSLKVGLALAVVLFAWFVWPTRYRYTTAKYRNMDMPVRIDRFTGRTELLYPRGWVEVGPRPDSPKEEAIPLSELAKVTGQCSIKRVLYDSLSCEIYNGSEWRINEIVVHVTVYKSSREKVLERDYRMYMYPALGPLASSECSARLGFQLGPGETWSWEMVSAKGTKD